MKTITKTLILLVVAVILIANNAEAKTKKVAKINNDVDITKCEYKIRKQIQSILDYPNYICKGNDFEADIIFKINDSNKIEILDVISANSEISNFIKKELNNTKVKTHPILVEKEYLVKINFKNIDL